MFGASVRSAKGKDAENLKQEIDALLAEYDRVTSGRDALKKATDVPFVWDVSFVEIFEGEKRGFDIVIGNPPYVRQESIRNPLIPYEEWGKISEDEKREYKKDYKARLAASLYAEYPRFFQHSPGERKTARPIDARNDLYVYFYFHGMSLLNQKGTFCFITSNSWLDVGFGRDLQEFLAKHARIKYIIDNQVKRSFAHADVNTVICLFSSPDESNTRALENTARFVMFTVPFENVLSPVIFEEIEEAKERAKREEYRINPLPQRELFERGTETPEENEDVGARHAAPLIKVARYIGDKWGGKYLRAPDIYWRILEKGKGKLVRLGDIAEVRFGIKTGANEFFYLDEDGIREWGIEKEFLKPVIKSPRECKRILIDPKDLKFKIFMCHKEKKDLKGTAALEYIKLGEKQGFHERPSCRGRARWWEAQAESGNSVFVKEANDTSAVFHNARKIPLDCRLYFGDFDTYTFLYLNSVIGAMMFEIYNRTGLGEGARSMMVSDYMQVPAFFAGTEMPAKHDLLKSIEILTPRIITGNPNKVWGEIDDFSFDMLNLNKIEQDETYNAVINLTNVRLNKAENY